MYFLVMYNLSGIQKGIQAGPAVEQYIHQYGGVESYQKYFKDHKTWIVLDGGGSIEQEANRKALLDAGVNHAIFREPDLNDAISAIAFLVPEAAYVPAPNDKPMTGPEVEQMRPAPGSVGWLREFVRGFRLASN